MPLMSTTASFGGVAWGCLRGRRRLEPRRVALAFHQVLDVAAVGLRREHDPVARFVVATVGPEPFERLVDLDSRVVEDANHRRGGGRVVLLGGDDPGSRRPLAPLGERLPGHRQQVRLELAPIPRGEPEERARADQLAVDDVANPPASAQHPRLQSGR